MNNVKADARETAQRLAQRYEARRKNPSPIWGIPYGRKALDGMTGGIQYEPNNDYGILFSPSSAGKTSLTADLVRNVAEGFRAIGSDKVVRCVLLEGGRDSFQTRIACMMADVPHRALKTGKISDEAFNRFLDAQREIFKLPIEYLDGEDGPVGLPEIDSFIRQDNTGWWVLDHIGNIPGARQGHTQLADISLALRQLCKATAPALILTHQNRTSSGPKDDKDQRPTMDNLAGSSFIVRDADVLMGIYRPDLDKSTAVKTTTTEGQSMKKGELIVLKNRDGDTGTIHMMYHTWYTRWEETDPLNTYWLNMLERT